ncbi:MAG: hypothetical protein ACWA5L_01610 [bacterium]
MRRLYMPTKLITIMICTMLLASCEQISALSQDGICAIMPFDEQERAQITELTIRPNRTYGAMAMKAETDRDMINDFYAFLLARKRSWRAPVSGVPEGTYIIELSSSERLLNKVGIGPGYLSAKGCEGYAYMRDLSPQDMKQVEYILGMSIAAER